ncbi:hypothetical protein [Coleofasciculus sp. FACHB-SPT36]|uniref:hypothetical protein n=1 Tax=Cyanophyceae TaxID=3028117 RepID=UPI00168B3BF4|nr:hypothetical protein [Coleofasciculus sp. FACHB-SPT36]
MTSMRWVDEVLPWVGFLASCNLVIETAQRSQAHKQNLATQVIKSLIFGESALLKLGMRSPQNSIVRAYGLVLRLSARCDRDLSEV